MRISVCCLIGIVIAGQGELIGQTTKPPAFDVASIKPSDPATGMLGFLTYPGGRVRGGHLSLKSMLAAALELQNFQISGGPGWIDDQRFQYDIDARVPASSESSKESPAFAASGMNAEQRQMLLTLLADRFQLKFHRETKEGSVFLLMASGKPLKLLAPKDNAAFPWVGSATDGGMMTGTGIAGSNASMPLLAERLMWYFERPVLDETGLTGSFDFSFELPLEGPPITSARLLRSPEVLSSIVVSLQGIGLKLEASKRPMEEIVIDGAQKPSAN